MSIGEKMDKKLVISSLQKAKKRVRGLLKKLRIKKSWKDIISHQDQGSQYTSYHYIEEVLKTRMISFSTPSTPTENPGQESFFGRFKDDYRDKIAEIETFEEAKKFIYKKIMNYYNNERLHTSLGNKYPREFTESFFVK